ncbi:hypothetical protein [Scytonema sp. NUACC26]|uniref:hypothetical protein n=1 Tax=Scytonema sp. NUACC26 TaxID=3140176 RepID=UPI0038B3D305
MKKYKPKPDSTNLEQVKGLLETFYHLCEIEAWEKASKILFTGLNTPTRQPLHNQLNTWGYYQEQISIYTPQGICRLEPTDPLWGGRQGPPFPMKKSWVSFLNPTYLINIL